MLGSAQSFHDATLVRMWCDFACIQGIDKGVSLVYHWLKLISTLQIFMVVWCYLAAVFRDPGGVPAGWTPFTDSEVMPAIASIQAI